MEKAKKKKYKRIKSHSTFQLWTTTKKNSNAKMSFFFLKLNPLKLHGMFTNWLCDNVTVIQAFFNIHQNVIYVRDIHFYILFFCCKHSFTHSVELLHSQRSNFSNKILPNQIYLWGWMILYGRFCVCVYYMLNYVNSKS